MVTVYGRLYPAYGHALTSLGGLLRDTGQLEEAELVWQQAIALRPDHAKSHVTLAMIQEHLGKLSAAERSYLNAIEIQPRCSDCYYNVGNLVTSSYFN